MTIDEVVEILNLRKHNGHDGWYEAEGSAWDWGGDRLSEFETIAVAEKYVRDIPPSEPPMPPTILHIDKNTDVHAAANQVYAHISHPDNGHARALSMGNMPSLADIAAAIQTVKDKGHDGAVELRKALPLLAIFPTLAPYVSGLKLVLDAIAPAS